MKARGEQDGLSHVLSVPDFALFHCDDGAVPVLDQLVRQLDILPLHSHEGIWKGGSVSLRVVKPTKPQGSLTENEVHAWSKHLEVP